MSRISARFAELRAAKKKAFISFTSAGDPDLETFGEILEGLPKAGVDLIEIGMPFSDPVADGPIIELGNNRAFKAGIKMAKVLGYAAAFRKKDAKTPLLLMGYANPIFFYGLDKFAADAAAAGIDGLIVPDLPPEEDADLRHHAQACSIDLIRFVTPTTDAVRLKTVLAGAGGFLYYVSVSGITGTKQAVTDTVRCGIEKIRPYSSLSIAVGFGISAPEQARAIAQVSDGIIVGSAIVNRIAQNLDSEGKARPGLVKDVLSFVKTLSDAAHEA